MWLFKFLSKFILLMILNPWFWSLFLQCGLGHTKKTKKKDYFSLLIMCTSNILSFKKVNKKVYSTKLYCNYKCFARICRYIPL